MSTVLIVDDSKLARIVVGKAVAAVQPDWRRVEAASAEEAESVLERGGVDLMIIDYNMPGSNGLELAGRVRSRYANMPIALATANVQDEIVAKARSINVTFVAKPISEEGLRGFLSGAALRLRRNV